MAAVFSILGLLSVYWWNYLEKVFTDYSEQFADLADRCQQKIDDLKALGEDSSI